MKATLLCYLQVGIRAAILVAKNRNGSVQLWLQLFGAIGLRQWLALLAEPMILWGREIAFPARSTATAAAGLIDSHRGAALGQAEEVALDYDVSDEALEIASGMYSGMIPTLANTYCFTCPNGQERMMPLRAHAAPARVDNQQR
jgi:hypothetical protein